MFLKQHLCPSNRSFYFSNSTLLPSRSLHFTTTSSPHPLTEACFCLQQPTIVHPSEVRFTPLRPKGGAPPSTSFSTRSSTALQHEAISWCRTSRCLRSCQDPRTYKPPEAPYQAKVRADTVNKRTQRKRSKVRTQSIEQQEHVYTGVQTRHGQENQRNGRVRRQTRKGTRRIKTAGGANSRETRGIGN